MVSITRVYTCLAIVFAVVPALRAAESPSAIPQNAGRQELARQRRRAWYLEVTVGAYQKVGRKSPKWDAAAERAIVAMARHWAEPLSPIEMDQLKVVAEACEEAMAAGCDDPLVAFVSASHGERFFRERRAPESARRLLTSISQLAESEYPAALRLAAIARADEAIIYGSSKVDRASVAGELSDKGLALVSEVAKTAGREEQDVLVSCLPKVYAIARFGTGGLGRILERQAAELATADIPDATRDLIEGVALLELTGLPTIAPDTWRRPPHPKLPSTPEKSDRLKKAAEKFERAWQSGPGNAWAAAGMLRVALGLGHDRADVETWFRRAMEADGDCFAACVAKLDYLSPTGYGNDHDLVAFGRACRDTGNWSAGIPLLLVTAHNYIYQHNISKDPTYRTRPEPLEDLNAVFTALLKQHPNGVYARTLYYRQAREAGRGGYGEILAKLNGPPSKALFLDAKAFADEQTEARRATSLAVRPQQAAKPISPNDPAVKASVERPVSAFEGTTTGIARP